MEWLKKCNSFNKLDFNPDSLIKNALTTTIQKRIPSMKLGTLMKRNLVLYNILLKQNIKSWFL